MKDYKTQQNILLAKLESHKLNNRRAEIELLFRFAIGLRPYKAGKSDSVIGATRFGGTPDLPPDYKIPVKKNQKIIQLNHKACR